MNDIQNKGIEKIAENLNSPRERERKFMFEKVMGMQPENYKIESMYELFVLYFVPQNVEEQMTVLKMTIPEIKQNELMKYEQYNKFTSNISAKDTNGLEAIVRRIIGLLVTAYMNGNESAKRVLKELYKTLYKKECKQLERFDKIGIHDLLTFCGITSKDIEKWRKKGSLGISKYILYNDEILSRVLFFSHLLGIEIASDCFVIIQGLQIIINGEKKLRRKPVEKYKKIDDEITEIFNSQAERIVDVMEEVIEDFPDIHDTYTKNNEKKDWGMYLKYKDFFKLCLTNCDISVNYFTECKSIQLVEEEDKTLLGRNVALLLLEFFDISTEEGLSKYLQFIADKRKIAPYIIIMQLVECFSETITILDDVYDTFLEVKEADKTKTNETVEKESESTKTVVDTDKDSLMEIARLERLLSEKEKTIHGLESELREKNKELSYCKAELSNQEKFKNEVVHLRDFVYNLTNYEEMADIEEISVEEKEEAIKNKNVVIIGGHTNWTKKVRSRFQNWKIVNPGQTNNVDMKIIDHADAIFFYTDVLKHSVYNTYIARCRDKKLCYGYLSSISFNKMIDEIYEHLGGT